MIGLLLSFSSPFRHHSLPHPPTSSTQGILANTSPTLGYDATWLSDKTVILDGQVHIVPNTSQMQPAIVGPNESSSSKRQHEVMDDWNVVIESFNEDEVKKVNVCIIVIIVLCVNRRPHTSFSLSFPPFTEETSPHHICFCWWVS